MIFDSDGVTRIINGSEGLSECDKELFREVFHGLLSEQERIFGEIKEHIEREMLYYNRERTKRWRIITTLIEKEQLEEYKGQGLYPVIYREPASEIITVDKIKKMDVSDSQYSAGMVFLNCRYPEVEGYLERIYHAHITTVEGIIEVEYKLFFSDILLEQEELLEKTAAQCHIEKPFLFSPFSRRAAQVKIDLGPLSLTNSKILQIDLDFSLNGLEDIVLCNKVLVWNVEITEKDHLPYPMENSNKKVIPLFDNTYEIYTFALDIDEYMYIDSNETEIKRIEETLYLALPKDKNPEYLDYKKIKINKFFGNITGTYLFENKMADDQVIKQRIRTLADISYVVRQFLPSGIQWKGYAKKVAEGASIQVYDKRNSYHYSKDDRLRSSSIIYLKFEAEEPLFFEDKVSYLLAYLNNRYPEFQWVGVI